MQIKNRITGTVPVIIHSPGLTFSRRYHKRVHAKRNPLWAYLLKHWEQASPPGQPGPDISRDLAIITWNTGFGKSLLERSLDRLGVPCTVLGRGHQNWSNPLKMALAREFLETVTTPYVLALDAYDVLVLDHPAQALQRFQEMNCDILFNAAMQFYPDFGKQNPARTGSNPYRSRPAGTSQNPVEKPVQIKRAFKNRFDLFRKKADPKCSAIKHLLSEYALKRLNTGREYRAWSDLLIRGNVCECFLFSVLNSSKNWWQSDSAAFAGPLRCHRQPSADGSAETASARHKA